MTIGSPISGGRLGSPLVAPIRQIEEREDVLLLTEETPAPRRSWWRRALAWLKGLVRGR